MVSVNTQYTKNWVNCNLIHYKALIKDIPQAKELSKLINENSVTDMCVKREQTKDGLKSILKLDKIDSGILKSIYVTMNIK